MRSLLLTATIFIACTSFLKIDDSHHQNPGSKKLIEENFFGLTVQRLSGGRVMVAWHTEGDLPGIIYEVMRKHTNREQFTSLGVATPGSKQDNTADYSFVDNNNFTDSSYYCLKKTNADSVIFYSVTKGVEGVVKEK